MTLPPDEIRAAPVTAPSESLRTVKILPVLLVLIIGTEYPLRPLFEWIFSVVSRFGWSWSTNVGMGNAVAQAILAIAILLMVRFWEHLPMRSIGVVRFAISDLVLGVATFLALVFVERTVLPVLLSILTGSHGRSSSIDTRQFSLIAQWPWPVVLATAASAGIFEEIWARGYGIERLEALTHSTLAASAITLALVLAAHVPFWGIRYAILIAPCQMLLLELYLWRRRLMPCVIAHVLWDAGRPIMLASMWLLAMLRCTRHP